MKQTVSISSLVLLISFWGFVYAEDCSSLPCRPPSDCENLEDGGFVCHCRSGIKGRLCDRIQVPELDDACSSSPCWNGAECTPIDKNDYTCTCPFARTGKNCRTLIDTRCYDKNPCRNKGVCRVSVITGEVLCVCPSEWAGRTCEIRVNLCDLPNPCYNGGTCRNNSCECLPNFSGYQCEKYEVSASEPRLTREKVIKIHNKGWYVARFKLTYQDESDPTQNVTQESTVIFGQIHVFNLTSLASFEGQQEIRLRGEVVAGSEIMDVRVQDNPQCFHTWGISLFPRWSQMPCW